VQVGDGTSGTNRLAPVAVSGLSAGVVMVAAGAVPARVFCVHLWMLRMILVAHACVACLFQSLREVGVLGCGLILRSA
jgi:hypothetical protein